MNTPPQLRETAAGLANYAEIEKWAMANCPEWVLAERYRKIHGWPCIRFHEVLASYLLTALVEARNLAIGEGQIPMPPLPPDPPVPPLYQISEDEDKPSRFPVAVLIGTGMSLALAAGVLLYFGEHWPAGICGAATLACILRASRYPV